MTSNCLPHQVRITDFGLATSGEGRAAGAVEVGTFRWMAPLMTSDDL